MRKSIDKLEDNEQRTYGPGSDMPADAVRYFAQLDRIEQNMAALSKRMDVLHERFAARPVAITWLLFGSVFLFMVLAGIFR